MHIYIFINIVRMDASKVRTSTVIYTGDRGFKVLIDKSSIAFSMDGIIMGP